MERKKILLKVDFDILGELVFKILFLTSYKLNMLILFLSLNIKWRKEIREFQGIFISFFLKKNIVYFCTIYIY